jgi:hypothetical protein
MYDYMLHVLLNTFITIYDTPSIGNSKYDTDLKWDHSYVIPANIRQKPPHYICLKLYTRLLIKQPSE